MTLLVDGQPAIRSVDTRASSSGRRAFFEGRRAFFEGRRAPFHLLLLLCTVFLSACDEPFIVMSGGALTGMVTDPPVDWSTLNKVEIVQLETRPGDPYSVNIWMAGIGPDIYVATGDDDTRWTVHMAENADVRLRVNDQIYELEANKVTDTAERAAVAAEYVRKYGLDADDNWVLDGQVFRLDRR